MKHTKQRTWAPSECNEVLNCIKSYPANLAFAFEQAANKLPNRSIKSIQAHYYKKLRNNNAALSVMSSKGIATLGNQKNSKRDLKQELTTEQQVEILMGMLRKLPRVVKKDIVKTILGL